MATRQTRSATTSKGSSQFAAFLRKGKDTYAAGEKYENMSFERIPAMNGVIVRLNLVEWRLSKNDNLMLWREHVILEGEYAGKIVRDHMMYGMSEFGDGKIRHYIKTVTGEDLPSDPAELEPLVASIMEKYAYDAKINISYSDNDFCNVDVVEVYDVDNSIDVSKLTSGKPSSSGSSGADEGDDDLTLRVKDFVKRQDLEKEMKAKGRSVDDIDDLKNEIADWTYDEDDLSEEDISLLEELELADCIKRKEPEQSSRRSKR